MLSIKTTACKDLPNQINYLEHVQAFITLRASRRGDVTIYLVSPMNTTSMLLGKRAKDDDAKSGFTKWPFMTTHAWAENPRGEWRLYVVLDSAPGDEQVGTLQDWTLLLHGTRSSPYLSQDADPNPHSRLAVVKRQHEHSAGFQF
jgi:proprotein convertase subtilisin/kexin type 2